MTCSCAPWSACMDCPHRNKIYNFRPVGDPRNEEAIRMTCWLLVGRWEGKMCFAGVNYLLWDEVYPSLQDVCWSTLVTLVTVASSFLMRQHRPPPGGGGLGRYTRWSHLPQTSSSRWCWNPTGVDQWREINASREGSHFTFCWCTSALELLLGDVGHGLSPQWGT